MTKADGGLKLNLGCGAKYLTGYVNCDVVKTIKADKYFNLEEFPYPFKENSVKEVLMDNVLEHMDDVVGVVDEVYRILRPGGVLKVYVPYGKTDWAFQDPTHKHYFTEKSVNYFLTGSDYHFYTKSDFVLVKCELSLNPKTTIGKVRYLLPFKNILKYFLFNIYDQLYFEIKAVKK